MADITSQRAKTAWLQIQNQINKILNDGDESGDVKQLRPHGAPSIRLADVLKPTKASRQLLILVNRFFFELNDYRDDPIECPFFFFSRKAIPGLQIDCNPWGGDVVEYHLPEYIKAIQQRGGLAEETWNANFVPIGDWVDEVSHWFDELTPRPNGYKKSDLRKMTRLSNSTLRDYTKQAGVTPPGRGKSNHLYTADETRKILTVIKDGCRSEVVVAACTKELQTLL